MFTVLPGVRQASPSSFAQDFPFELGEDRQQAGHRTTRRSSEIERLSQRDETDPEMLQLLKCRQQIRHRPAPAIEPPHQNDIDLAATRRFHQLLAGVSLDRSGADLPDLHGKSPTPPRNILPQSARLHRQSLLIIGGHTGV